MGIVEVNSQKDDLDWMVHLLRNEKMLTIKIKNIDDDTAAGWTITTPWTGKRIRKEDGQWKGSSKGCRAKRFQLRKEKQDAYWEEELRKLEEE